MKKYKILTLAVAFIGLACACSSTKDKTKELATSDKGGKPTDSIQIRSTSNSNMSNTYPSN